MIVLLASLALAADPAPPDASIAARMAQHLVLASGLHEAVIDGDLAVVKERAAALAALPLDGLPRPLKKGLDTLVERAAAVDTATTLPEAAAAVAGVVEACGACHAVAEGPEFGPRAVHPVEWDADHAMPQHEWAANWMRLGIIGVDAAAFQRGASTIATAPILPPRESRPEPLAALETTVQRIGREGARTDNPARWVGLYGELIGLCATCHQAMASVGTPPP